MHSAKKSEVAPPVKEKSKIQWTNDCCENENLMTNAYGASIQIEKSQGGMESSAGTNEKGQLRRLGLDATVSGYDTKCR